MSKLIDFSFVHRKFVGVICKRGGQSRAIKLLSSAYKKIIKKKNSSSSLSSFVFKAVNVVSPVIQLRPRHKSGVVIYFPAPISRSVSISKAVSWIVKCARLRTSEHGFSEKLSSEIIDAYNSRGKAVAKKTDVYRTAFANRALIRMSRRRYRGKTHSTRFSVLSKIFL